MRDLRVHLPGCALEAETPLKPFYGMTTELRSQELLREATPALKSVHKRADRRNHRAPPRVGLDHQWTYTAGPLPVGVFVQLIGPYMSEDQSAWYCDEEIPLIEMQGCEAPIGTPTPISTSPPSATGVIARIGPGGIVLR